MSWHFRSPTILQYFSLTIILLLQCICNGAAIKCFVCDSSDNPSCADLKSNSSIVPEECTLDKTKSIDTWLFELNRFAYFDTGSHRNPLMNCQKVVARDQNTNKMVTARFCQLDTGDSDACLMLRSKLRITSDDANSKNGNNNGRHSGKQAGEEEEEQFHCSICLTDRCNGSDRLQLLTGSVLLSVLVVLIMQQHNV